MTWIHHCLDPDERFHVRVQSVVHQLELPIWGDEGDGAVVLEPCESDALVELDVLHLHGLSLGNGPTCRLEEKLVVEAKLELGHPREVRFHLERTNDLRPQNRTVARHQEIQLLDHVQEDLVLLVFDTFRTPRDSIGHRCWRTQVHVELVGLVLDVLSEDLHLRCLRVPIVHHLIQKLVGDDKVVLDALLFKFFEVVPQHLCKLIQERHDEQGVGVALRRGEEIEIVVPDPHQTDSIFAEHRLDG
mmetsp:Transcript_45275/g.120078  ORF Transcript_45275/g.120078 Transcript_45275/m.120078 type:complete len:245 (-) Transcript_45275:202-936(-)